MLMLIPYIDITRGYKKAIIVNFYHVDQLSPGVAHYRITIQLHCRQRAPLGDYPSQNNERYPGFSTARYLQAKPDSLFNVIAWMSILSIQIAYVKIVFYG